MVQSGVKKCGMFGSYHVGIRYTIACIQHLRVRVNKMLARLAAPARHRLSDADSLFANNFVTVYLIAYNTLFNTFPINKIHKINAVALLFTIVTFTAHIN